MSSPPNSGRGINKTWRLQYGSSVSVKLLEWLKCDRQATLVWPLSRCSKVNDCIEVEYQQTVSWNGLFGCPTDPTRPVLWRILKRSISCYHKLGNQHLKLSSVLVASLSNERKRSSLTFFLGFEQATPHTAATGQIACYSFQIVVQRSTKKI